jgi:hypothetical protein
MTAKTGAERSQKLRDKEAADGIVKLTHKLTATERQWIQTGQDLGGYDDVTEFLLAATKAYIEKNTNKA